MAYRDAAAYIEKMKPDHVAAVSEECRQTKQAIHGVVKTLFGLVGRVTWHADAADLYQRRLKETVELLEGLHDGFEKAGSAIAQYAEAQRQAQTRLAAGTTAEHRLRDLIAPIAATQSWCVSSADALRQWNDLRSSTGVLDRLAELPVADAIERVRADANRLWNEATTAYDDAIRIESTARARAVGELAAAYRLLPDFRTDSSLSETVVRKTPGLVDTAGPYRIGPPTRPHQDFDDDFPYDPTAQATLDDYLKWVKWKIMLYGAQLLLPDLDDATALYAHYQDTTGTPMLVDYEEAYQEDEKIKDLVNREIELGKREAERIFHETGQTAFQMTGDLRKEDDFYPDTENWQKTLGAHTVYGTADVAVHGDKITMKIKIHADDMYNFNKGQHDVKTGVPDDENGRFSTLGWAKGFRTYGVLERTVTWTIGETEHKEIKTGSPTRDAPGEDRVDGLEDG